MKIDISATIREIRYKPLLCSDLNTYTIDKLANAISKDASFILKVDDKNQIAFSWWVSPKRTRSYPYARVYDTFNFAGKKVTLIPIIKDEGFDGDRDYLQWDTISLMSLLGVYVIISYYNDADRSNKNKITNQRFDLSHVRDQIAELLSYQSDALHWNLSQIDRVSEIANKALDAYDRISNKLNVKMKSRKYAEKRIKELSKGKDKFLKLSRDLAKKAQAREVVTVQPKENLRGVKGTLTIKNYLGGCYFFTADEVELDIKNKIVYIIEGKHTKENKLPSLGDIKDGLFKIILNANLSDVKVNGEDYKHIPVLKLTTGSGFDINASRKMNNHLEELEKEARINNFRIKINNLEYV